MGGAIRISRGWIILVALAFVAGGCRGGVTPKSSATPKASKTAMTPVESAGSPSVARSVAGPEFTAKIDNPLFPYSSVRNTVFKGTDEGAEIQEEARVLDKAESVAGISVLVVEVKTMEDGELVERSTEYYAQRIDGSVWFFGERVDNIDDGEVTGHEGQWIAGEGNAKASTIMPAAPKVGDTFQPENVPGVADLQVKVIAADVAVSTPAGNFSGCIRTEDVSSMENTTEYSFYCRGVGLVRREFPDGSIDLVSYS
jgi:hypothetical protein